MCAGARVNLVGADTSSGNQRRNANIRKKGRCRMRLLQVAFPRNSEMEISAYQDMLVNALGTTAVKE